MKLIEAYSLSWGSYIAEGAVWMDIMELVGLKMVIFKLFSARSQMKSNFKERGSSELKKNVIKEQGCPWL